MHRPVPFPARTQALPEQVQIFTPSALHLVNTDTAQKQIPLQGKIFVEKAAARQKQKDVFLKSKAQHRKTDNCANLSISQNRPSTVIREQSVQCLKERVGHNRSIAITMET
ncbi:MAG: hypothetical protein R2941_07400 [Desulfobacterales bacterium]